MEPITTQPTPGDVAAMLRRQAPHAAAAPRPAPVLNQPAAAAAGVPPQVLAAVREALPTTPPPSPAWSRTRYESALLASALHPYARLLALVLARHADATTGHIEHPPSQLDLIAATGLTRKQAMTSRGALTEQGWLIKPHRRTIPHGATRPLTLTIPPAHR